MNLTEDNYLDYSIENFEETIDSSVNLFGMNSGHSYVEPYDSNGNFNSELNNSKYNEYKEIVTNYFVDLDDDLDVKNLISDNHESLKLAKKYNVNYILIDKNYDIQIDLFK